ncbi:hypothetical protein CNEO2_30104 [Clostridium neonatale]|nr:hypothetical protein CNEO2_30104 [Clostridium neonatale]
MLILWELEEILLEEAPMHIHFKETSSLVDKDWLYCNTKLE